MKNSSKHNRDKEMFELLKTCKESGLSKKEFCKQQGIGAATFYYWQKKYQESQQPSDNFIPVQVKELDNRGEIEICYPNGVRAKVPFGVDMSVVRMLIGIM